MELAKLSEKFLTHFNLKIPDNFLKDRIISHPNYPSMLSLTDTLDELGIEYNALKIEKHELKELQFPILGHLSFNDGNGDFEIFMSPEHVWKDTDLNTKWDGIVLELKENATIKDAECKKAIIENQKKNKIILAVFISFSFATTYFIISNNSLVNTFFNALTLFGCLISSSLILQSLGKSNTLISTICGVDEQSGCEIVKKSSGSKIKGISLENACFAYFASQLVYIVFGKLLNINSSVVGILFLASVLSFPVTIYSLYYQGFVVKKWCRLCLLIVAILWLQLLLIFPYKSSISESLSLINNQAIILAIIIFSIIIIVGSILLNLLKENKTLLNKSLELLRYKRQPLFFLKLLEEETKINDEIWENDIVLGNPEATVRILIACNPYCKPCAETHSYLHSLLTRLSSDICLIIRFAINASNTTNKKFIAASYILESYYTLMGNKKEEAISDWFETMDIEEWKSKWAIHKYNNYETLLQKHQAWSITEKIKGTPTIFINGYKYPDFYRLEDIKEVIPVFCNSMM